MIPAANQGVWRISRSGRSCSCLLLWVAPTKGSSTGEKMLKSLLDHGAALVKGTGAVIAAAEVGNTKAVEMILEMRDGEVNLEE